MRIPLKWKKTADGYTAIVTLPYTPPYRGEAGEYRFEGGGPPTSITIALRVFDAADGYWLEQGDVERGYASGPWDALVSHPYTSAQAAMNAAKQYVNSDPYRQR